MSSINLEYIYYQIYLFITRGDIAPDLTHFWLWLRVVSYFVAVPFFLLVVYFVYKIVILRLSESTSLREISEATRQAEPKINPAWEKVLEHMSSSNPNEWRLGIIEADKMLDDLVKAMNYAGETLGERLQRIEPSDFVHLNEAWEAHKVRNRIAHESDFNLSEHEARLTIARYRAVFEEFGYI